MSINELQDDLAKQLQSLKEQQQYRTLKIATGIDFSSNDYLGLSQDDDFLNFVRLAIAENERSLAAPAARLLSGTTKLHVELEQQLATFKGTEKALLLPSGYQANMALLTSLVRPHDRVLSDEQNHASLIDAIRLTGCKKLIYPHLDTRALKNSLEQPYHDGRTFMVTESLFSMDGDMADLAMYADLAARHGAYLIVDDAHSTGVYGATRGSGLLEHFQIENRVTAVVFTLGKALGFSGGCIGASNTVIDYVINCARPFIFTTAQPPLLLIAIQCALEWTQKYPELRARVLFLADLFRKRMKHAGINTLQSCGPIVPVVVSTNERALHLANVLQEQGFDARAIRPPTVAENSSRVRICIHANHTEKNLEQLAHVIINTVKSL